MTYLWQRIDHRFDSRTRPFLEVEDECYYGCDYTSKGGFDASDCNNRIDNLKKHRKYENDAPWKYKSLAAGELAQELAQLLPTDATITFIPCSKCTSDPEHDPRWELVWNALQSLRPDLVLAMLFHVPNSVKSARSGNRAEAADAIEWAGFGQKAVPKKVWIIDDVLTTGRHFKRCKGLLRQHYPAVDVAGVFWARVVDPPVGSGDEDEGEVSL